MFWRVISDVKVLHWLILVGFYLVAHREHLSSAGATRHFPEIYEEHVAFVGFDDALEDAVALGQWLILHHLDLVLLNEITIGQYTLADQIGVVDNDHRGSKVIGNNIVLILMPFCGAEEVTQHTHLGTEVGWAEVQLLLQFVHRIYLEFTSMDMLFLCNRLNNHGIVLEGAVV